MINKTAISMLTPQICIKHQLTTNTRKAMFLGQCSHESGNFTQLRENLNYSAKGLINTFKVFKNNLPLAQQYARQPQKIANFVYANRYGNGNVASGDGWFYRGFGYIQLTFKSNWLQFVTASNIDIINKPSLLNPETAIQVSLWYWDEKKLAQYDDDIVTITDQLIQYDEDVIQVTKIINGGTNGLADRQALYNEYLAYFNSITVA